MPQITCISKDDRMNPYERITHVGGAGFKYTSNEAIQRIEKGQYFFVNVRGKESKVVVQERNGKKVLKTEADDYEPNNLLSLPECP